MVIRMARPPFKPTEDQLALLQKLAGLALERGRIDAEADALIVRAHEEKIPIFHIAEYAKRERKTVYKHLEKMAEAAESAPPE